MHVEQLLLFIVSLIHCLSFLLVFFFFFIKRQKLDFLFLFFILQIRVVTSLRFVLVWRHSTLSTGEDSSHWTRPYRMLIIFSQTKDKLLFVISFITQSSLLFFFFLLLFNFQAPEAGEDVDYHFVALVEVDGQMYELDGMKESPIPHGPTSNETFLEVWFLFFFLFIYLI